MDGWDDSGATRFKDSKAGRATRAAGGGLAAAGKSMIDSARDDAASQVHAVQYKRGGKVRKTGPAVLHKNERVIPASKRKTVERMMKRKKMRMTNRGRR